MHIIKECIEFIFSVALFVNASLFVPQIILILRTKSANNISLATFLGFFLIQIAIILHGIITHDTLLIAGYAISMLACGTIVVLILLFNKNHHKTPIGITAEEILAQLPGHVYCKDKNGVCLESNTNTWKDFGLKSLADYKGKTDYDLMPADEAKKIALFDKTVMEKDQTFTFEEEFTANDGKKTIYLSYKSPLKARNGEIVGIVGVSVDITQTKQETLDKLDFLESIIAVMPGNVYWMDRNGVYLGCNDNEAKAVGLKSRQEIVGKRNVDIPGFVIPDKIDAVNKKVFTEKKIIITEEPAILADGSEGTFFSSKVPICNRKNEIVGLVGISLDITELKKAKEKAETANEAKEAFLKNMRHDLRTPFSGILTLAQLMADDETDQEKKENLQDIADSAKVLLEYMNKILDHAQLGTQAQAIIAEPVELENLLRESMSTIKPMADAKGLHVNQHYAENIPKTVISDKWRLQRIAMNLLGNAVKFTDKGDITLGVDIVSKTPEIITLCIWVKDTGIGIPANKYKDIFEKFTRLEAAYTGKYAGTGLGLYDVKQLCRELGGDITVSSELHKGSIFSCTLPFKTTAVNELMTESKSDIKKPATITRNTDVLLVEDQPVAAMSAARMLRTRGYTVDIAETGFSALEKFHNKKYDIILMDIGLPDIDGIKVTQKIRQAEADKKLPKTPVIAVTAHPDQDETELTVFNKVCGKPFSETVLIEMDKALNP